jgi:hypothetical protein
MRTGVAWVALISTLTACGGWGSDTPSNVNTAPDIETSNLSYSTAEMTKRIIDFSTIINSVGATDRENDLVSIKNITTSDSSIVVDYNSKTVTFNAPNVVTSENFNASITFQDSKWAVSEENANLTFTSVDGVDDSPTEFNPSDLIITSTVREWDNFKLTANPIDEDGIYNISYSIKDNNWTPVNGASWLLTKWDEQVISNLPLWFYTVEVIATWFEWWENVDSVKTLTKPFNVVSDIPVEITDINIASSFEIGSKISLAFTVPETSDATISVGYEIINTDTNTTLYMSGNLYPNEITNYTVADYDTSSENSWNYKIRITAVNDWNTASSTKVVESAFTIEALNNPPEILQTSFESILFLKTETFNNVVSDDWGLANISITGSTLSEWIVTYNWDWSITYTRTDWNSGTTDTWDVTFSDWNKSTIVSMSFAKFDDE